MKVPDFVNFGMYRGYEIGAAPFKMQSLGVLCVAWRSFYRDRLKKEWEDIHILTDSQADALVLAKQVVDYAYLIEAFEAEFSCEYDPFVHGNLRTKV